MTTDHNILDKNMAIREIVTIGSPILRKKAHEVKNFRDTEFQKLIDDMIQTTIRKHGAGLAAPQVAISQRLIVVMLLDDKNTNNFHVVANPEIVWASKTMIEGVEACLSIPGYFAKVERHQSIIITGQDRHGRPLSIKAKDWLARVFQHEIDHLNGMLFTDLASGLYDY